MPYSIEVKLGSIFGKQKEQIQANLQLLSEVLKKEHGIDGPRDDSRLSYKWACGEVEMTLEEVAKEIYRMSQLFENTDYKFVAETVVDRVSDDLFTNYGLDKKTANILATRYIIAAIKTFYNQISTNSDPMLVIQSADISVKSENESEDVDILNTNEDKMVQ